MNFEYPEDRIFFQQLLCGPGETISDYLELFDFRSPPVKRREFNKVRDEHLDMLVAADGKQCLLRYRDICDIASGIAVDHVIPLSSNKLNKELRHLPPLPGKKVLSQSFGSNNLKNLIVACNNCNNHKKHRFLEAGHLQEILRIKRAR